MPCSLWLVQCLHYKKFSKVNIHYFSPVLMELLTMPVCESIYGVRNTVCRTQPLSCKRSVWRPKKGSVVHRNINSSQSLPVTWQRHILIIKTIISSQFNVVIIGIFASWEHLLIMATLTTVFNIHWDAFWHPTYHVGNLCRVKSPLLALLYMDKCSYYSTVYVLFTETNMTYDKQPKKV